MNLVLYVLVVLIWGTTWIALKWQLGPVPIPLSIGYRFALAALVLGLVNHRIGENNHIATPEIFVVNPVHYHPVACLQLGRKPALRHREDSKDIGAHCPSQEQRQHQCY